MEVEVFLAVACRIFHHDKARDEPLLEVSHLNRTEVSQLGHVGDISDLWDFGEVNMTRVIATLMEQRLVTL